MCFLVWWHLSIYYVGCQGMLSSALSSVRFARFTFPEGLFSSNVLLSQPTIFVLSLAAKCTVIGLRQHMMKILGLLHLSPRPLHDPASAISAFHTATGSCGMLIIYCLPGYNQEGPKKNYPFQSLLETVGIIWPIQ